MNYDNDEKKKDLNWALNESGVRINKDISNVITR